MTVKKTRKESQEQQVLVQKLCWLHPDIEFFSIPNGGRRGKNEARQLVLEGVEKGTPDLFIAEPRKKFKGLFVELKRAEKTKSKVSQEQTVKHDRLKDRGYQVIICYGAEEAYYSILDYMGKNKAIYMDYEY